MHQEVPRQEIDARLAAPPKLAACGVVAAWPAPVVIGAIAAASAAARNAMRRPPRPLMTCIGFPPSMLIAGRHDQGR
jgi:uncharacterized RDD family membrane protein YckC